MENTDLAYAAGLLDGEGTVTLSKNNSSDKFRTPAITMSSTTYALLEFMKNSFGGNIVNHKIYKDHHKQSWVWHLRGDAVLTFLGQVVPFVREHDKKRRADLLLKKYKLVTVRNGKYTEEQLAAKQQLEHEFFHPSGSLDITPSGAL